MTKLDQFRGCLIGGAAGDALGYAVEFQQESQIFRNYGTAGITAYDLARGSEAYISDDTQMTLFTANALLLDTAGTSALQNIAECYREWYRTQFATYAAVQGKESRAWLMQVPELFATRAPGNTCLSAIMEGASGSIAHPINQSKGCGGVMRVAPIGLYDSGRAVRMEETDRLGAEAAALTHGHELGYIPAAALVHIIRMVTEQPDISLRDAVEDSIRAMQAQFPHAEHIGAFTALMEQAVQLAASDTADLDAIHTLGEGWVAEEMLAIAVFCALRYPQDFSRALIASVNHNGDSDSTGAVTGNILGAYLGYDAIPEQWKEKLELREVILELAEDLCTGQNPEDAVWRSKYLSHTYRRKA